MSSNGSGEEAGRLMGMTEDLQWIRIDPLGISVTPLTALEAASVVAKPSGRRLLLNHNLHSAYLHDTEEEFRRLYQSADWVIVDGAPILWLASWYSKRWLSSAYRVSSTDWIAALPQVPACGRMFIFGAAASSNTRAIEGLQQKLKGWTISGVDGYVDDEVAIKLITDFEPDVVIVGLGMPRQEHFLLRNVNELPDATYATVGGAIDYLAGTTRLAPRWLGRVGIEWFWRFVNEPRRLAHRYLVEPALLIRRVAIRSLSRRRNRL